MAAVAGAGGGGGDEMLALLLRPRRRRIPLSDLTNLSSASSDIKAKGKARTERKRSPGSSTSSIGSSTNPRIPMHPPPPPPSAQGHGHGHVAGIKGKDKATRELQTSAAHLNKIQNISKPKVKTGGVLPGPSSTPSVNTRKITRKEQPLYTSSKTKVKTAGDVLPAASTPPSKKTMKITRKEQVHMETEPLISPLYASSKMKVKTVYRESSPPSKKTRKVTSSSSRAEEEDDEMSWDEGPSKEFIEERRAYFAEVDAVQLVEEFVSSGSDAE